MRRLIAPVVLIVVIASVASVCLADALSDGRALYKSGQYAQAASKLEQATRENPTDSHAWWQLNFAYNKLGRYADALKAATKAADIDPKHTFASDPGKYAEIISRLRSKVGATATHVAGTAAPASTSTRRVRTGSGSGNITQQLTTGDVYVAPGMRVDAARLQAVSTELEPTVVKFVVFDSFSDSRTLSREADRIRKSLSDYMNRGQGYVIVMSRRGIAVSSSSLSAKDLREMTRQVTPRIGSGDLTGGLEALARGLVKARSSRELPKTGVAIGEVPQPPHSNVGGIMLGILGFVVVVVLAIVAIGKIGAGRRMSTLRGPIERQKGEVITQMNSLDEAIPTLSPGAAARVREARVSAGTKLDEAARLLLHAKSERDLNHAQSLLDAAQADLEGARALVNRGQTVAAPAAGAKAAASGTVPPVYPAAAQTTDETDWSKVPEKERGVCFFCSRPSLLNELTPVTVKLSDQPQKVLACATDLATIKNGQVPQIRAFEREGKYVPWYADNGYDPYRDYYGRGYGGGSLVSDMIMLSMIDNMYWGWHRPMGWGYGGGWGNTYVFYPDHEGYRDYYSSQAASQNDPDLAAGGSDFLQDVGPGDTQSSAAAGADQS